MAEDLPAEQILKQLIERLELLEIRGTARWGGFKGMSQDFKGSLGLVGMMLANIEISYLYTKVAR